MVNLNVTTVRWSGFPGGPGTSTFYFHEAATYDLTALHDFYGLLLGIIPSAVTLEVLNVGATIDATNGDLVGAWSKAPVSAMTGSNAAEYASGVGATVRWETGIVAHGRAVRGRTYMCPLYGGAFDVDGSLDGASQGLLASVAATTIAAYLGELMVWHRPLTVPTVRAGEGYPIQTAVIPDRPAMLRSRRR